MQPRGLVVALLHAAWVGVALYGITSLLLLGLILSGQSLFELDESAINSPLGLLILFALQFAIALAIVSAVPIIRVKGQLHKLKKLFGVDRRPQWRDLYLPVILYPLYFAGAAVVLVMVSILIPAIDLNQAQDVGFRANELSAPYEYVLAFLALVVIAPIAEELLFRGYLYGKVRPLVGVVAGAVITSVTFGLIHGQANVAIDTFVLSLFMCGLREKTGAIWAAIVMHALKNGLAFTLLFIFKIV